VSEAPPESFEGPLLPEDAELQAGLALPYGRRMELLGRGTTFFREIEGPPGAPVVVLLHGWLASGGTNWFQCFDSLGEHFRVIAPDLRGHGRGLRSKRRFRLADCADDTALLLDELGIEKAIFVGYSMGGPVAQLMWHRHRERVAGLVLCATSHSFVPGLRERMVFTSMMMAAAGTTRMGGAMTAMPTELVKQWIPVSTKGRPSSMSRWAAGEMRRHDWRMVMEAGYAIGHYDARRWISYIDVPSLVLITERDRAIPPDQQGLLADAIPGTMVRRIDEGHTVCALPQFGPPILKAVEDVAEAAADRDKKMSRTTKPKT
jgi:3-oxoadipate enol-lactonase